MASMQLHYAVYTCFDAGAIKAIYSGIDFTKDGINEVAIGRDNGSLEVYGFDQEQQPVLVFHASLEESISTVDGGFFSSPNVQVISLLTDSCRMYIGQVPLCMWVHKGSGGTSQDKDERKY